MFKKFLFFLLLSLWIVPSLVYASSNYAAKIGDKYYENLEDAIANASSTDIIILTSNAILDDSLLINKTINIDLNNHNITAPSTVFLVQGGTLNITGKGTIKETEPNYGAIMLKGSKDPSDTDYSVVNVGKDVTLEGWSGIFINHESSTAYGVKANLSGKINAVDDTSGGSGVGVYVNGNIKHQNNPPVINISDGAQINSTGNGLYIAGYSIFNIKKAHISGVETAIGIKAGILNIDGATVTCTGKDYTPTEGYNNGIKASGTTLQIESNNGYAGNIEIDIKDGQFTSKNSNVIYEYIGRGNDSLVNDINISGGTYRSEVNKNVFLLSDQFKSKHPKFITGGKYSSDPSLYLKSGYNSVSENDMFSVVKSTMKEVDSNSNSVTNNNSFGKILIILIFLGLSFIIIYLNRNKIIKLLKK